MGTSHAEGEALRRLIEKWRKSAEVLTRTARNPRNGVEECRLMDEGAQTLDLCADELEAALAPLSGPVDASGEPRQETVQGDSFDAISAVKSVARMLGWMNVPPLRTLERDIAALKARAAAVPSSPAQEPK